MVVWDLWCIGYYKIHHRFTRARSTRIGRITRVCFNMKRKSSWNDICKLFKFVTWPGLLKGMLGKLLQYCVRLYLMYCGGQRIEKTIFLFGWKTNRVILMPQSFTEEKENIWPFICHSHRQLYTDCFWAPHTKTNHTWAVLQCWWCFTCFYDYL